MSESHRQLLYIVAFIVFFPASLIVVVLNWIVRRRKEITRSPKESSGTHWS